MADYLTDEMKAEVREVFQLWVKTGNDMIETSLIPTILRNLALTPPETMITDVTSKADPQGEGAIDVETLIILVGRVIRDCGQRNVGEMAFRVFDKDNLGTITHAELRHVLTNLPGDKVALTDEEFDEFIQDSIQAASANNLEKPPLLNPEDGLIHYEVMCEFMRKFNKEKG
jgi:Ca2+-binding EF-hand superfamily protein